MVVSSRGDFILVEDHRGRALLLRGNLDRNDLRLEAALLHRRDRLAMRVHGKLVLLFARDAVLLGDVLAGDAHVVVVVDVPQAVVHHGVDDLRIAEAISLARLRQKIRRVGHGLHAAGDDDGLLPV